MHQRHEHSLIITDLTLTFKEFSIAPYIYELERTSAQLFFLGLSLKSFKPCNQKINYGPFPEAQIEYNLAFLNNGIVAWQFEYEKYAWNDAMLTKVILLRNKDFLKESRALLQDFTQEEFYKMHS